MKLRIKTILILLLFLLIFVALVYSTLSSYLKEGFEAVENTTTRKNVERVEDAFQNLITQLHIKQSDWSAWDDTYQFVHHPTQGYITSNLTFESVANIQVHFMLFVNETNTLVHSVLINTENKTVLSRLPAHILALSKTKGPLLEHTTLTSKQGGLMMLGDEPYIVVSQPILTSERVGPARGSIIWGSKISDATLNQISTMTHLTFEFFPIESTRGRSFLKDFPSFLNNKTMQFNKVSDQTLFAATTLNNFKNEPTFIIQIESPRLIWQQGLQAITWTWKILFAASLVFALALMVGLSKLVITPLDTMGKNLSHITSSGDLSLRIPVKSKDEIGILSILINKMLNSLEHSQRELSQVNTNLAHQVEETELLNRELIHTQQQLLQSQKLESIGKLAGGIAHDFNNLLGGIMGYAALLKEQFINHPDTVRQLDIIIKSAERGEALTQQLLGFARQGPHEKKKILLNDVILETVSILDRSLRKEISLITHLAPDLLTIEADSGQLLQALMNLVINAQDAIKGNGAITLTTRNLHITSTDLQHRFLSDGDYVELIVHDTGQGIPRDILDKIFDPFFTTKDVGKGSGLGLAMVYGIVENHGGSIRVESTLNQETAFYLYFPTVKT